jgi:hypothetical protein
MIAAMAKVGSLFEAGEYYITEMLILARTIIRGLSTRHARLGSKPFS